MISDQQRQCVEDALLTPNALEQWLTENEQLSIGRLGSPASCPMHNFLASTCPDIKYIQVVPSSVCLYQAPDDPSVYVENPPWVREFIRRVDNSGLRWIMGVTGLRYLREIKEEVDGQEARVSSVHA